MFDASFFRVWGAIYAVLTLLLWTVVFSRTAVLVNGRIFDAPCLQSAELDATAAVVSSSSSQAMRTVQQEQKRDQEKEAVPTPSVPVGRLSTA